MNHSIADADQRELALNPERSFIIQAPAGSGKTELLIQRYLRLLSLVESPEEIIAITFTRKAAAEMRTRVLQALNRGLNDDPPQKPHEHKTWELARAVLKQNDKRHWMLTENPARFKIQTIDSLCAGLTRQMPILSRFGTQPQIIGNPRPLYLQAARKTIADLESGASWSPAIQTLVRHLDNYLEKVEQLIAGMLAKRDQWLRHVVGKNQRLVLENSLEDMIADALFSVRRQFPESGLNDLFDLSRFAAGNLKAWGSRSPICALDGLEKMPGASCTDKSTWLGICELLLIKEGGWRKTVTKNMGFPAPSSVKSGSELRVLYEEKKELFKNYIEALSANESLAAALHNVRSLPDERYSNAQWDIMEALFEILRVAVGYLMLVFGESGQVDFAEIALRAKDAMGEPESPTDLTLSLDFRIRHILVDEFQDTSFTQYELLERLTAGWEPGDGRTFFAVGDPMQSIYGFREAEVGLFIKARRQGLGQIPLNPITLSVNFRSQKKIVDWINDSFPKVMPSVDDETIGAVSYCPSIAFHEAEDGQAVAIHPFVPADSQAEADMITQCICEERRLDPESKIAILVRSRTHLETIVPALKSAGVSFRAVEIESLKNRPVIGDLLSLSRAISHPADRIAWLAVLRAPWCGLTLNDLYALASEDHQKTVMDLMADERRFAAVSADGQKRLSRVREILVETVLNRQRKTFRRQVEGAWLRLGGPACVFLQSDMEDVSVFFDLLDQQVGAGTLTDVKALETAASELFARPDTEADDVLQIMTIHRAKGLEFDVVILPGLEKTPPPVDPQLLLWLERYSGKNSELLLAPIAETGGEPDNIYNYIKSLYEKKRDLEDTRVLYVAATRAKKRLYLMGGAGIGKSREFKPPAKKSLLVKIWPVVKDVFYASYLKAGITQGDVMEEESPSPQLAVSFIRRFTGEFNLPEPPPDAAGSTGILPKPADQPGEEMPLFDWAGETVRRSGSVIHLWLKMICQDGIDRWSPERINGRIDYIRHDLIRSGISPDSINTAVETVLSALIKTITDARGRWILSEHKDGESEFALTGRIDNEIVSRVIDRTFVDENGIRWIIDYKSGVHKGGSIQDFLDQEKMRYLIQMQMYAKLMFSRDPKIQIRLGLYFPLLQGWREWAF